MRVLLSHSCVNSQVELNRCAVAPRHDIQYIDNQYLRQKSIKLGVIISLTKINAYDTFTSSHVGLHASKKL